MWECLEINIFNLISYLTKSTLRPFLRDYLINELDVEEVNFENFSERITKEYMKSKNDNWAKDLYLIGDPHLNEKGHRLVAEQVIKYLK